MTIIEQKTGKRYWERSLLPCCCFYLNSDNIIVLKDRLTLMKNVYCKPDITEF